MSMVLELERMRNQIVTTRIETLRQQLRLVQEVKKTLNPYGGQGKIMKVKVFRRPQLTFGSIVGGSKSTSAEETKRRPKPVKKSKPEVIFPSFKVVGVMGKAVVLSTGALVFPGQSYKSWRYSGLEGGKAVFVGPGGIKFKLDLPFGSARLVSASASEERSPQSSLWEELFSGGR